MYVVRNIFQCKPGKAKELVAKFKEAAPHLQEFGVSETRILTDAIGTFWTVSIDSTVSDLGAYMKGISGERGAAIGKAMAGYMDLIEGGRRELYKIE